MPTRIIHILGTGSGVGKSSLCLGVLAWLLKHGVPAGELSYIKPMTQCVELQAVTLFCDYHDIAYQSFGPVVFSKGFTREFFTGKTPDRDSLLNEILATIDTLAAGKRFLFVDGIGHPAVGSTIGVSNVVLTNALNNPIVLLVGQPGIGATIDSLTLCLTYLQSNGIRKVGVLLNKIPRPLQSETFRYVKQTIKTNFPEVRFYGCLPELDIIRNGSPSFDIGLIAKWIDENISAEQILFGQQINKK